MEHIDVKSGLKAIQDKLNLLLTLHAQNQEEIKRLKEENKSLKDELKNQKTQIEGFQYKEEISKIVSSVVERGESSENLRTRIDEYIKEIDNCINFLSKEL